MRGRTFVKKYTDPPDPCKSDINCIGDGKAPLLKYMRTNLIDPDTPKAALTKKVADGSTWNLAVSRVSSTHNLTNNCSSRTNSTRTAVRFIPVMIHFSRLWIYGTE